MELPIIESESGVRGEPADERLDRIERQTRRISQALGLPDPEPVIE
jgi:hypothetical protein